MALLDKAVQLQVRYPAPIGGINTRDSVMAIGPEYAFTVNNMVPKPLGLEVRKGYIEWLNSAFTLPGPVRTIMSFNNAAGVNNKLFASVGTVDSDIYDISTPDSSPAIDFSPGPGADVPGEWSYTNFSTPGGSFLCAVLPGVGYFNYDTVSGWVQITTEMLPDPAPLPPGDIRFEYNGTTYDAGEMVFCFTWKNRLWFLQKDTGLIWYLPVNQIVGEATALDIGQFLRHGGALAYAVNWTYDSGSGMDDNLIFVGQNGDMVIYQGSDPDTAGQFLIRGTWYIGRVPVGRRGFCQYGGDVVIATEFGMLSVADLVTGRITDAVNQSSIGEKYNPTLSKFISDHINDKYWQLISYPKESIIYVASPALDPIISVPMSFVMGHFAKAWATITDFPAYCLELHEGQLYFGTTTGKIYTAFDGYKDNASYGGVSPGNDVIGLFQTGFYDYGTPTSNKRAQRIRLLGLCDGSPNWVGAIRSEYDLDNPPATPNPVFTSAYLWDVAIWDEAYWTTRAGTFKKWFGVSSFGKKLSTQVAIRGVGYTLVTDYEVTYENGIGL